MDYEEYEKYEKYEKMLDRETAFKNTMIILNISPL